MVGSLSLLVLLKFKLNVDGASDRLGIAMAAALILSVNGQWVRGFQRMIGFESGLGAEFWALRDGFIKEMHVSNVVFFFFLAK